VTIINQIAANLLNLRGVQLRNGICRLLRYIDHGIDEKSAFILAELVLRDPIVASPMLTGHRLASVIQREELTILLLRMAAGEASELQICNLPEAGLRRKSAADWSQQCPEIVNCIHDLEKEWDAAAKAGDRKALELLKKKIAVLWLRKSIGDNGLTALRCTLEEMRNDVLKREEETPALSTSVRTNQAILAFGKSDFIAKLNSWFDQTIDRVDEAFSMRSLICTLAASLVIAFALQLDALSILNRLGVDDQYRRALVGEVSRNPGLVTAISQNDFADLVAKAKAAEAKARSAEAGAGKGDAAAQSDLSAAKSAAAQADEQRDAAAKSKDAQDALADILNLSEIIEGPTYKDLPDYLSRIRTSLPGILLSAALLSLGGPFWYEMLKNLLKLRSTLATRDDQNRKERQSTQPSEPSRTIQILKA
jgi:hypothetical protein